MLMISKDLKTAKIKKANGIELSDYDKEVLRVNGVCTDLSIDGDDIDRTCGYKVTKATRIRKKKKKPKRKLTKLEYLAYMLSQDQQKHPTPEEGMLLSALSKVGETFYYQHPLPLPPQSYCSLDFYFPKSRVAVELDGYHHYTEGGILKDSERTRLLKELHNIKVIRFENKRVRSDVNEVVNEIFAAIRKKVK